MFKWRLENRDSFYTTMVSWWSGQNAFKGKTLHKRSLPQRIYIVSKEGVDLFAVPVFASDADFCYIGFITGNPACDDRLKVGALEWLYGIIETTLKYNGFHTIITTSNVRSLMKTFENAGYETPDKTNYYLKNL